MCCHLTVFFYYYKKSTLICMHIVEKHAMIAKKNRKSKKANVRMGHGCIKSP